VRLIYLFRRLVFAQVLLGIVAFCMAEQNPGMLLIAGAIAALSWYVTEGPTGRPLPKWAINVASLAAVAWLALDMFRNRGNVVVAMGHFTIWLQVIMLYARKSNREYGQLLVLSMLQMVGASVLSVSMIYGALLAVYCLLAIFTLLIFHLKSTSDLVWEMNRKGAPPDDTPPRPKPVAGRGQRWHLRLTALSVGLVCAGVASLVFVVLPRSEKTQLAQDLIVGEAQRQPGFTDRVELGHSPGDASNRQAVMHVRVWVDGQPATDANTPWLLRGAALDQYNTRIHTWTRSRAASSSDMPFSLSDHQITLANLPEDSPRTRAEITLRDQRSNHLFTLHPVTRVGSRSLQQVEFSPLDQTLSSSAARLGSAKSYTVWSVADPPADLRDRYEQALRIQPIAHNPNRDRRRGNYATGWSVGADRLRTLARGILTDAGLPTDQQPGFDADAAAHAIARHLVTGFEYTLENPVTTGYEEPLIDFLLQSKRGHCELFAAAHAALLRVLGVPARVITGYRASEVNPIGDYYIVRQNHAHAWTEVNLPGQGWTTFDPTPAAEVQRLHDAGRGWFAGLTNLYDYLEHLWISSVVAYDADSRDELMADVQVQIKDAADTRDTWLATVIDWVRQVPRLWRFDKLGVTLAVVTFVFILVGIASLTRTIIIRRRRMAALQLTALPRAKRRGLARRLRFYLNMLDLLERYGYHRPEWQSPFSFAQELADADPMRFDPVVALTELFYEIRFGHRDMTPDRRDRVRAHLKRLEQSLGAKGE